jgi:SynChlorMet cassette radical SAM/SPASM protein ScmF
MNDSLPATGNRMFNKIANPLLTSLYLYLTDHCNLSCGHCWISPKVSADPQNGIRLDALKKCISEAKSLGLQGVKLTGGEPLLYRDLDELLSFLASDELEISIETNGTLFDRNMLESFQSSKVEQISVSLDAASAEVHDEIRGQKGSFQRSLKGLRLLADYGLNFQIIMTLQRKNRKEIPGLISLSEMLGAGSLKINPLQPCGRAMAAFRRGDNLELDELVHLYRTVEQEWSRPVNLEIFFDLPLAFLSIEEIRRRGNCECKILNILGVLANGDFSICGIGQTVDDLRMGNLSRVSICDVWQNNPVLKELRQSLPRKLKGICHHCIFKFQCLGGCRANAYALAREFYAPYFLCQEFFDSGLFPSSRYIR